MQSHSKITRGYLKKASCNYCFLTILITINRAYLSNPGKVTNHPITTSNLLTITKVKVSALHSYDVDG